MMGLGQVVTLRLEAEWLREVNFAIEHGAGGAFQARLMLKDLNSVDHLSRFNVPDP
jgi:hypothetical protein